MNDIIELRNGKYLYMCDYNRLINAEIKDRFLAQADDQKLELYDIEPTEHLVRKKVGDLSMITLEVTQQCNLRCKYCVYNDNYDHYRPFTTEAMTWETAKKAIDYAYSLVEEKKEKKFNIGFYGGEPLLNKEVIRKGVEYGKKRFNGWDLNFNMTSNLTTLDLDILQFIIDNNFSLSVSLDGGQEIHDAKRVFAGGAGTFTTVMKHLELIRKTNREFFEKKVNLTAVHALDLPFENVWRFFESNDLLKGKSVRLSNVNQLNTHYYDKYSWDPQTKAREFNDFDDKILSKLRKHETLTPLETFINNSVIFSSEYLKYRSFSTLAQTCLFDSRLYIDAGGGLHICERMNNAFPIGDLEHGLDFENMSRILKDFASLIKSRCSTCDIRFLCNRCFASLAADGTFEIPDKFCEGQRKSAIKHLEKYILIQEERLDQ